jgi:hypothetical protein
MRAASTKLGGQVDSRHPANALRREITGRAAEAATEIEDVHAGPYACMFRMLARCHDTAAVQLVEGPQVAVARPLGIDPSGTESIVNPRYYRPISVVALNH